MLTSSDRRAKAGINVGGASLCLSTSSSTRMNLHAGSLAGPSSIVLMVADSCAIVSQRLRLPSAAVDVEDDVSPDSPSNFKASATEPTIVSNKCLAVMHCAAFMTAYFSPALRVSVQGRVSTRFASSRLVMLDLPVASVPWRTRLRQGAALG